MPRASFFTRGTGEQMNRKRFRLTAVAAVLVALTCVAIAFAASGREDGEAAVPRADSPGSDRRPDPLYGPQRPHGSDASVPDVRHPGRARGVLQSTGAPSALKDRNGLGKQAGKGTYTVVTNRDGHRRSRALRRRRE